MVFPEYVQETYAIIMKSEVRKAINKKKKFNSSSKQFFWDAWILCLKNHRLGFSFLRTFHRQVRAASSRNNINTGAFLGD
jgi:hypothetical protein